VEDRCEHRRHELVGVLDPVRRQPERPGLGPDQVRVLLLAAGERLDRQRLDRAEGGQRRLADLDDRQRLVLLEAKEVVVARPGQRWHGVQG